MNQLSSGRQETSADDRGRADDEALFAAARRHAVELLRANASRHGFVASSDDRDVNYYAVWGRDGSICAIGALQSGERDVEEAGRRTLLSLAAHQADNGQIPSYLLLDENDQISQVVYGGLGGVTSIDSNLWFLIAACFAVQKTGLSEFGSDRLRAVYAKTLSHLQSIDSDNCGLLEIPAAGDWSDILDRSYHILYDEVLWYRALICSGRLFRESGDGQLASNLMDDAKRVKQRLNEEFWWEPAAIQRCRKRYFLANRIPKGRTYPYYQSHLKPFYNHWFERFDAFGNVLACLTGVAPADRCERIIEQIYRRKLDQPYPLRVLDPPVLPDDPDWDMIYEQNERPFSYHNGGTWPLAGAFWTILLASRGRRDAARSALRELIRSQHPDNESGDSWRFPEYLHGKTGMAMGHRRQSWNAASLILAIDAVRHDGRSAFFDCGL